MNRNAKGAIAVGAATLLLLGGGGTFALWNDAQTVNAQTVSSGELSLVDGTPGAWYEYDDYIADPDNATPLDLSLYHVVPEAELIFVVEDFSITAEGSDLHYTFLSNVDAAAALTLGYTATVEILDVTAPDLALPGTAAAAAAGQYFDGTANVPLGTTVYSFNSATPDTVQFTAGLKVVFDADGTDDFNSDLVLSTLEFQLKQVVEL
ncbi:MAG TPA: alternate-type signal peptide domain-containing protein [Microbacteriaceae bacterium]|nr:alternate-type signal peptide domain-containing protein [Microbacteriaceae bacterium]